MHLKPAEVVIRAFNGIRSTARMLGRHPATVGAWAKTGNIPTSSQSIILDRAEELGLDITANDLIRGRDIQTNELIIKDDHEDISFSSARSDERNNV